MAVTGANTLSVDAARAALARLSPGALAALGASEPAGDEHRQRLRVDGLWWIEPLLANQLGEVLGLRRIPGLTPEHWPFVVAHGFEALTVASTPAQAVPMRIFCARLFKLAKGWLSLQKRWSALLPELQSAHRALGGQDMLEPLTEVVTDDAVKASILSPSGDATSAELVGGRVLRSLDPGEGHVRYRAHIDALRLGTIPEVLDFAPFGAWASAAAANSVVAMRWTSSDSERFRAACWALLCAPAALDAAVLPVPTHCPLLSDTPLADHNVLAAAQALADQRQSCPTAWTTDPFFGASMALAKEGKAYDGAAHLECAERLAASGAPARAFVALQCAAFWSRCNHGTASADALRAAASFAQSLP